MVLSILNRNRNQMHLLTNFWPMLHNRRPCHLDNYDGLCLINLPRHLPLNTLQALKKLMESGIPGMENLFKSDGSGDNFASKFVRMSDDDKRRFLAAVTGSDGKVNSKAAAILIAAAASGGDPEVANKIVEKMMTGLGDEIDPAMMAALMATTAMASQGASNEEVSPDVIKVHLYSVSSV